MGRWLKSDNFRIILYWRLYFDKRALYIPRQDFERQSPHDFYRLKKRYFIVRINNETIKNSFQSHFIQIKHQSGDFIIWLIRL